MSEAKFFNGLTSNSNDLRPAIDALSANGQPFCLIRGLAVNHSEHHASLRLT